jgi:hypothetical protein
VSRAIEKSAACWLSNAQQDKELPLKETLTKISQKRKKRE